MTVHLGWLVLYGLVSATLAFASAEDRAQGFWGLILFLWASVGLTALGYSMGSQP